MLFGVTNNYSLLGKTFNGTRSITATGGLIRDRTVSPYLIPAAKTGALTTRTDDNTGTLTMDTGHGITTGIRIDIYWVIDGVTYCQRGVTVGTVSVDSVPFDLGVGDNLPADETDVTVGISVELEFEIDSADVVGIAASSEKAGTIVFAEADDSEVYPLAFNQDGQAGGWDNESGVTNPFIADVAKVFLSHGNSDGDRAMMVGAAILEP